MFMRRIFMASAMLLLCVMPTRAIDGFLDLDFNDNGTFPEGPGKERISFSGVFLPIVTDTDFASNYAIAVDQDGNYVSVGFATSETAILNLDLSSFAAVKVDPDGEPVTSFGQTGFAVYNFADVVALDTVDQAFDIAVDSSGNEYILAGRTNANGSDEILPVGLFNFGAVKASSTGALDPNFENNLPSEPGFGIYNFVAAATLIAPPITIGDSNDEAFGVAIDNDGNYVFAGRSTAQSGSVVTIALLDVSVAVPIGVHNFAVVKTTPTGLPDPGFGGNFISTLALSSSPEVTPGFGIYSFVDTVASVGISGLIGVDVAISLSEDQAFDVAVDPSDNSYILAGLTTASATGALLPVLLPGLSNFGVVKINASGVPDPTFRSPGYPKDGFGSYNFADGLIDTLLSIDGGFSVAVDQDGNYVIAGVTTASQTGGLLTDGTNIAVLKISPTGGPIASFGNSSKPGYGIYDLTGSLLLLTSTDAGFSVCVDDDNKYVVVGTTNQDDQGILGDTGSIAVLRLTTDGQLDPTFNPQGFPGSLPQGPGAALVGYDGSVDVLFIDNILGLSTPGAGCAIAPSDGAILAAGGIFDVNVLAPVIPLFSGGILGFDFSIAKFLDDGAPPMPPVNPLIQNLIPMAAG